MSRRGNPWLGVGFDAWMLGLECSTVIAQRTLRIAAGGPVAGAEAARMVTEKIDAALALQRLAMTGALGVDPAAAMARTVSHYRRKVRANGRRPGRRLETRNGLPGSLRAGRLRLSYTYSTLTNCLP